MFFKDEGFGPLSKNKKRKALLLIIKSLDPKVYKKAKKILKEGNA